ncbi:SDR family NAD(P)-dependent oxidoreductase [Candidatus Omnitrophota bacterium]
MKNNSWKKWYRGKTVLITGATSGIGLAMARELASVCSCLLLVGRNQVVLDSLPLELMKDNDVEVLGFRCDLSQQRCVDQLIFDVKAKYKVDVLINNAGFGFFGAFSDHDPSELSSMVDVNVTALSALTLAFVSDMKGRQGSGILNVGSVASFFPIPGSAMYGATKYFVRSFTEALHRELLTHHVHVSGLYPGVTYSDFLKRATHGQKEQWERAMTAEDVALQGLKGLAINQLRVVPGLSNKLKVFIAHHVPVQFLLMKSRFKD